MILLTFRADCPVFRVAFQGFFTTKPKRGFFVAKKAFRAIMKLFLSRKTGFLAANKIFFGTEKTVGGQRRVSLSQRKLFVS